MKLETALAQLRERDSLPLFVGEPWDLELGRALRESSAEELFAGHSVQNAELAAAAIAGLHLWNDDFEASHNLCQGISTPTGSYWHGLCHRREGHRDRGLEANLNNTRYWFRQTGAHPAFPRVRETALAVLADAGSGMRWVTEAAGRLANGDAWDPFAMVDWFGQADAGTLSPQTVQLLQEIQRREIAVLLDWCVEQAVSG